MVCAFASIILSEIIFELNYVIVQNQKTSLLITTITMAY